MIACLLIIALLTMLLRIKFFCILSNKLHQIILKSLHRRTKMHIYLGYVYLPDFIALLLILLFLLQLIFTPYGKQQLKTNKIKFI